MRLIETSSSWISGNLPSHFYCCNLSRLESQLPVEKPAGNFALALVFPVEFSGWILKYFHNFPYSFIFHFLKASSDRGFRDFPTKLVMCLKDFSFLVGFLVRQRENPPAWFWVKVPSGFPKQRVLEFFETVSAYFRTPNARKIEKVVSQRCVGW